MRLTGHHALVTGGGTGIGAAVAQALAREGARLTLVGRRREPLETVAQSLRASEARDGGDNLSVAVVTCDVTDRAAVDRAFEEARRAIGPITILVNNAGAADSAPFAKTSIEAWQRTLSVNLDAVFHCCQAALSDLLAAEAGRIVTIASIAGLKGGAYIAPYVAAKHGAVGLTRALAAEFAGTALTVNAVCPGFVETDIVAQAVANIMAKTGRSEAEARAALVSNNPQRRTIQPAEVAAAIVWLCLAESGSVNGRAIAIDGGETQ